MENVTHESCVYNIKYRYRITLYNSYYHDVVYIMHVFSTFLLPLGAIQVDGMPVRVKNS